MSNILDRIKNYLQAGGLFNPELMEHNKVSDLIIDCQIEIEGLIASEIAADAEIERLNRIIKNEERMRSYYVNELVECRNLLRRFLPKDESDWDRIIQLTQTEKDAMEYFRGKDVKRTR